MANHIDVRAQRRVSSSPRACISTSASPSFRTCLGPAFGDSGLGSSVHTTPISPLRYKLADDTFFTAHAPALAPAPAGTGTGSTSSSRSSSTSNMNKMPTRHTSMDKNSTPPRGSNNDASVRLAFHRMRFQALDSSPSMDDDRGHKDEGFVPSVLGPPLSQSKIVCPRTPPLLVPRSRRAAPAGGLRGRASLADATDDSGYSGSEEDSVPAVTLSPAHHATSHARRERSRRDMQYLDADADVDADADADAAPWFPRSSLTSAPAIVSTPPETPRRRSTAPCTPPKSRPSASSSKYYLPRSPGTPHLRGASELTATPGSLIRTPGSLIRTPGLPMPRSPGCRSLSSLT